MKGRMEDRGQPGCTAPGSGLSDHAGDAPGQTLRCHLWGDRLGSSGRHQCLPPASSGPGAGAGSCCRASGGKTGAQGRARGLPCSPDRHCYQALLFCEAGDTPVPLLLSWGPSTCSGLCSVHCAPWFHLCGHPVLGLFGASRQSRGVRCLGRGRCRNRLILCPAGLWHGRRDEGGHGPTVEGSCDLQGHMVQRGRHAAVRDCPGQTHCPHHAPASRHLGDRLCPQAPRSPDPRCHCWPGCCCRCCCCARWHCPRPPTSAGRSVPATRPDRPGRKQGRACASRGRGQAAGAGWGVCCGPRRTHWGAWLSHEQQEELLQAHLVGMAGGPGPGGWGGGQPVLCPHRLCP